MNPHPLDDQPEPMPEGGQVENVVVECDEECPKTIPVDQTQACDIPIEEAGRTCIQTVAKTGTTNDVSNSDDAHVKKVHTPDTESSHPTDVGNLHNTPLTTQGVSATTMLVSGIENIGEQRPQHTLVMQSNEEADIEAMPDGPRMEVNENENENHGSKPLDATVTKLMNTDGGKHDDSATIEETKDDEKHHHHHHHHRQQHTLAMKSNDELDIEALPDRQRMDVNENENNESKPLDATVAKLMNTDGDKHDDSATIEQTKDDEKKHHHHRQQHTLAMKSNEELDIEAMPDGPRTDVNENENNGNKPLDAAVAKLMNTDKHDDSATIEQTDDDDRVVGDDEKHHQQLDCSSNDGQNNVAYVTMLGYSSIEGTIENGLLHPHFENEHQKSALSTGIPGAAQNDKNQPLLPDLPAPPSIDELVSTDDSGVDCRTTASHEDEDPDKTQAPTAVAETKEPYSIAVGCCLLAMVGMVVAAISAVVVLLLMGKRNSDDLKSSVLSTLRPSSYASHEPTSAPSANPTTSWMPSDLPSLMPTSYPVREHMEPLVAYLEANSDGFEFYEDDKMNPNYLAIHWLLDESQELNFRPALVRRFALVSLDFALSRRRSGWNQRDIDGYTLTWSIPLVDECSWKGIVCENLTITELHLARRNLIGSFADAARAFQMLPDLTYIDFSDNAITGSIPSALYELTNLESLYLYKNQLTGIVSSGIGGLSMLANLYLNENSFTGPFPSALESRATIRPLRYLNLYKNQFNGTIPSDLRLRNLFFMDIGYNHFTGTLPADIGEKFVRLRHLHLDHNQFVGSIPETYPNIGNNRLETLTMNHNQLTGSIPSVFELRDKLVMYTLQNNSFTVPLKNKICKLSVFQGGEAVEFEADCNICRCDNDDFFCDHCRNSTGSSNLTSSA